tara:strand:+ start:508 stop:765 length:258 start_codon:yes stop_codon:yes gene_type:complete
MESLLIKCGHYGQQKKRLIEIGNTYLIAGGGNHYGSGEQIFKVTKITSHGNIYGTKHSKRNPEGCLAKNHRLNPVGIIRTLKDKK